MRCATLFPVARLSLAAVLGLVLSGWLLSPVGWAAEEGADAPAAESVGAQAVADLGLAQDLIAYGRKTKTPEALITAALILHRTAAEKSSESLGGDAPPAVAPAELLAEAKKLRPDDKELAGVIARAQDDLKEKSRGAVGGPKETGGHIDAGKASGITVTFKAKEVGRVGFYATGKVSVNVQNQKPNVRLGWNQGQNGVIGFVPPGTGPVLITVTNLTKQRVHVKIWHN